MLAKTHLAFGFLAALILKPMIHPSDAILFFAVVLLGSLLPDIDSPESKISHKTGPLSKLVAVFSKHRGIFHSLFFAALIAVLVGYLAGSIYGIALCIGYLSHLIIDGFTIQGINFLHPVGKLYLSGFIKTGSIGEWIVFAGVLGLIGWMII